LQAERKERKHTHGGHERHMIREAALVGGERLENGAMEVGFCQLSKPRVKIRYR
jgi:hypothetical protein